MAPNIYNGDFHKTLYDVQEVIPKTTEINQKTFISRNRLYKLTEYQVVGSSSYNGFIQIEFYNFGEGLKDIYSYFEQNDFDLEEEIRLKSKVLNTIHNFKELNVSHV